MLCDVQVFNMPIKISYYLEKEWRNGNYWPIYVFRQNISNKRGNYFCVLPIKQFCYDANMPHFNSWLSLLTVAKIFEYLHVVESFI